MKLQAVNIQTESDYNKAIEVLTGMGFKPFQIKETFRKCYLTIENRYMQLARDSKMLTDKGYETISFEEFINPAKNYLYKLPKEFAEKWVAALRSGDYQQGERWLFSPTSNTYCCLGVACRLAGVDNQYLSENWIKGPFNGVPKELIGSGNTNQLAWELSKLNDRDELTFPEIADWIEENVFFTESEVTHVS